MNAVSLRPKQWLRLTESDKSSRHMGPKVAHTLDEEGNSTIVFPQEKLGQTLAGAA